MNAKGTLFGWRWLFLTRQIDSFQNPVPISTENKIEEVSTGVSHALVKTADGNLYGIGIDNEHHLKHSVNVVDLDIQAKLNLGKSDSIHSFVAGRKFSAFLTKKKNLYIWGQIHSFDFDFVYDYQVPTFIPVENKMYRDILFSNTL